MVRSLILAVFFMSFAAEVMSQEAGGGDIFIASGMQAFSPRPALSDKPLDEELVAEAIAPLSQPMTDLINPIAREYGLDPKLLHALVIVESGYNPRAKSPVGAQGLTQLMPQTAKELGVDNPYDSDQNLRGGAQYLAMQIRRFKDLRLALAAYNSGPNRVARLGRIPHIEETQTYVKDAIDCYLALSAGNHIKSRRQCRAPKDH